MKMTIIRVWRIRLGKKRNKVNGGRGYASTVVARGLSRETMYFLKAFSLSWTRR